LVPPVSYIHFNSDKRFFFCRESREVFPRELERGFVEPNGFGEVSDEYDKEMDPEAVAPER
jgi:hypothetical protein